MRKNFPNWTLKTRLEDGKKIMDHGYSKSFQLSVFAIIAFFIFYYVQALYYLYFFYAHNSSIPDWSVYAQGFQLIQWNDLNPYLAIRGLRIFNDHFDPIIIPFSLTFAKIFPPALAVATIEIFFFAASAWLVFYYGKKRNLSPSAVLLMTVYILLNKGTVEALLYPSHPTSWSTFAFVSLGIAWMEGKFKWVLASLLFLYACKEEFPLVGFMVAAFYFYKKRWKEGGITFFATFLWFWFSQHRDLFFEGKVNEYNGSFFEMIGEPSKIFYVTIVKSIGRSLNLATSVLLLCLPLVYAMKKKELKWGENSWALMFFSIPLFIIRALYQGFMMMMQIHYFSQLTSIWGMAMFSAVKKSSFSKRFLLIYGLLLFLFSGSFLHWNSTQYWTLIENWRIGDYFSVLKSSLRGEKNEALERKRAFDKWTAYLADKGDRVNIFVSSPLEIHFFRNRYVYFDHWTWRHAKNLESLLSKNDGKFHHKKDNENYLLLAKNGLDLQNGFIKSFLENAEILEDNAYLFVAKTSPLD